MRDCYQPVRFPGSLDESAVLQELERLKSSPARLPLLAVNLRKFSGLLRAPILELDRMVRCVEHDPLLAVSVLRLVTDELARVDPVRISDCIVLAGRDRLFAIAESANFALPVPPVIDEFAERSRVLSLIASRLAISTGAVDPAAARLAGLLHTLGEIPILLSGCDPDHYAPATIAGWGKRLASSWHLPSALVSAIAAYDTRLCEGTPDPMQLILGAARRLVNRSALDNASPAVVLLDRGERTSGAAKFQRFS